MAGILRQERLRDSNIGWRQPPPLLVDRENLHPPAVPQPPRDSVARDPRKTEEVVRPNQRRHLLRTLRLSGWRQLCLPPKRARSSCFLNQKQHSAGAEYISDGCEHHIECGVE